MVLELRGVSFEVILGLSWWRVVAAVLLFGVSIHCKPPWFVVVAVLVLSSGISCCLLSQGQQLTCFCGILLVCRSWMLVGVLWFWGLSDYIRNLCTLLLYLCSLCVPYELAFNNICYLKKKFISKILGILLILLFLRNISPQIEQQILSNSILLILLCGWDESLATIHWTSGKAICFL